jgi:phosphate transport system protein
MSQGLRTAFDREFVGIQENLLRMRELVDTAIARALESLKKRDFDIAQQIIDDDEAINQMRYRIEEDCVALIATQQPTASDLRSVVAIMNVVVDMERMADYASGIATTVIRMGDEPLLKPLIDIPKMVRLGREMLQDAIQALITKDVEKAREIAARDHEMDQLYIAIFDELVEIMADKPDAVARATYLLWCAHNLERIGDRVTNIAERAIFVRTGDLRELND